MSYNPIFEASKAVPLERVVRQLEDFAATGQDLSERRFDRSPPPVPSGASTGYETSEPPSPGTLLQDKEAKELRNSEADKQYTTQIHHEVNRIQAATKMGLLQHPVADDWEAAEANVRHRWIQQGIWDERWDKQARKIWKHELEDSQLPGITSHKPEGLYHESIRSAIECQTRQLSRPCYQFVYQFCQERQWIKMGFSKKSQNQSTSVDTRAYENIKSRWIGDGIWDNDWTLIPGVSWKHERPRKFPYPDPDEIAREASKAARMAQTERPPDQYFMAPAKPATIYVPLYKSASDPSSPSSMKATSREMPPRFNDDAVSRTSSQEDYSRSTRQCNAPAGPNTNDRKLGERVRRPTTKNEGVNNTTKTKQKQKPTQKKRGIASRSSTARPSIREDKGSASTQPTKGQQSNTNARSLRPRRTAASVAMSKLTKAK